MNIPKEALNKMKTSIMEENDLLEEMKTLIRQQKQALIVT
jgi:hypothetical protein